MIQLSNDFSFSIQLLNDFSFIIQLSNDFSFMIFVIILYYMISFSD